MPIKERTFSLLSYSFPVSSIKIQSNLHIHLLFPNILLVSFVMPVNNRSPEAIVKPSQPFTPRGPPSPILRRAPLAVPVPSPLPGISSLGGFQGAPRPIPHNPAVINASLSGPRPDVPRPDVPRPDVPRPDADLLYLLSMDEQALRGEVLQTSQLLNYEAKLHNATRAALNDMLAHCRAWERTAATTQAAVTDLQIKLAALGTKCQHLAADNHRLKLTLNNFVR